MYNWSTDEEKFKKEDPEGDRVWRLTQLINYGLDGEKLSKSEIKYPAFVKPASSGSSIGISKVTNRKDLIVKQSFPPLSPQAKGRE